MTAHKNNKMNVDDIIVHIQRNMEDWLFDKSHISCNHINATDVELKDRIGRMNANGVTVTRSGSFLDANDGDDIVAGLKKDLIGLAEEIEFWLNRTKSRYVQFYFDELPYGVDAIYCSTYSGWKIRKTHQYYMVLCRNEDYSFYLKNVYPIKKEEF